MAIICAQSLERHHSSSVALTGAATRLLRQLVILYQPHCYFAISLPRASRRQHASPVDVFRIPSSGPRSAFVLDLLLRRLPHPQVHS
jgi:hypothetical protein